MDPNQQAPQQPQQPPQQVPGGVQGAPTPQQTYAGQPLPQQMPGEVQGVPGQQAPPNMNFKAKKKDVNSTQNALHIAEIRDGIVIMDDGSYRAVIHADSINFDLMSPEERESVEYAYQGFLNSLYFPIQIFMRSSRVDIRPYIDKLDRIRQDHDNMLLALLMDDYIRFIDILSQETNIMDKNFYIVIPYHTEFSTQFAVKESKKLFGNLFSAFKQSGPSQQININEADLEKAKQELRNRVQAVTSGLRQMSVNNITLDTEQLIELYYDAYNPDTATRQKIRNFDDLTAPIIEKGQGDAAQPNLNSEMK